MLFWLMISIAGAQTSGSPVMPQDTPLPICFKLEPDTPMRSDRSYKHFRDLFRKNEVPDHEVLARLIYAETRATGEKCQEHATTVSQHIASTLFNRLNKRNNSIDAVVFEPSQFASSLHFYKESSVKHFLCPHKSEMWEQIVKWAREIKNKKYTSTLPPTAVNYYLYQHPAGFKPPAWTKKLKPAKTEASIESCVRFFENPKY